MAGQEPASAPQGGGFRLYARGFRQDATRVQAEAPRRDPRAGRHRGAPAAAAWSSSGNGGGAVHRREAAGVAVETPRVEQRGAGEDDTREGSKTWPRSPTTAASCRSRGANEPGAVRARSNNKSNNDDAPINPAASAATVGSGVDGEDEEEARRSSREEPMVVKAEDVERAKAEAETRERAIAEAGERRKERSETKSPSIAKKVVKKGTAKKAPQSNPKVVIDSEHDHLFEEETPQRPLRVQKPEPDTGDEAGASYGGGTEGRDARRLKETKAAKRRVLLSRWPTSPRRRWS